MATKPWSAQEIVVVVLAQVIGLAAAAFCTFIAVLYVPEISLATYRPTSTERAVGVGAVVVGSVLQAAGPLAAWFLRRTRIWLAVAAVLAVTGGVMSVLLVQALS